MHALIPAGGAGTRLWPLSRRSHPKFLLDLTGCGRTMLQATADRLTPVSESVTVITGTAHAPAVHAQLPDAGLITEPSPRDSMPAIGLGAAVLHVRHGTCTVGSFAADHEIADTAAFHRAVERAQAAAQDGFIATIGITPTEPATGYGYIARGPQLAEGTFRATAFHEKPGPATASRFVSDGYLWNAGMFVTRTDTLLDALAELHPEFHNHLMAIAQAWDTAERDAVLAQHWEQLEKSVIDRAIAEPLAAAGRVAVIPAAMGWSDVGDYATLAALTPHPAHREIASSGTWVHADTPVVVVGVPDAVVVQMDDVILVTTTPAAQQVKDAVAAVEEELR